ncbi:DUF3558 domain-containing protein [Amycolatopsis rhabdoformis]|uniref:DUF3558 domain-containing protein n=1 Tax=Amycolatopsis rhabdoformis TaxID=1448059 RepID=A0ABZ1I3K7_9PSEU|nr:DUF3558 domain-containing protein [Amycolatopsis rhabdoformis]WSE28240.1 DUF3558 domain-containing protein [Amycolatopsis rhabdoformis]
MRLRTIVVLFATAVATSACATSESGHPPPSSSAVNPAGAPKVTNPLTNTSGVEANPCTAVAVSDVEALGGKVSRTTVDDTTAGLACGWIFADGSGSINAGFATGAKDGLGGLYARNASGSLKAFEVQPPVRGYPAVVYDDGLSGSGACALAIGVRDDLAFIIDAQLRLGNRGMSDPCAMATELGGDVIAHLKSS